MAVQVDPEAVIARLSIQVGQLYTEIAMRDVALENLQAALDAQTASQGDPDPAPPTA